MLNGKITEKIPKAIMTGVAEKKTLKGIAEKHIKIV